MKITLKRTDEQVELVKAMASRDRNVAYEAQQALAEFIGPLLAEVVNNAPTLSNLFTPFEFAADDSPSIPLDLYYDVTDQDYIKVYSTNAPGGLPSNHVTPTHSELKLHTYRLESAVDFDKRYAARSRLDVVSKTFTRQAQEILIQQENTSAALLLGSIADADSGGSHILSSNTKGVIVLDDFNQLLTKAKRNNPSWQGGTPETSRGITDLVVSPEVVQSLREMAYNPINTRGAVGTAAEAAIPATDSMRDAIYNGGGIPEFYGISIMEIYELGAGQKFTKVAKALSMTDADRDDIVIGLDKSRDSLLRAVAVDAESGTSLTVTADDQYVGRSKKIGWYAELEEGRTVINDKALISMKV